ncbi:MAG: winged helix-turn-helix domain-containing protein [Xanthobacteraceae bacterium]|jgi:molybdate transport system regulatory protein
MSAKEKKSERPIFIRFDLESGPRIGPGKIAILEAIASTGSISAAARQMGMSYRKAWLLIDAFNNTFSEPVISTETGGDHGGGAKLTKTGEEVLRLFRDMELKAIIATEPSRRAFEKLVKLPPSRTAQKK